MKIFLIAAVLVLVSCQKKNSPEGVLNDFINYRFESGQTKEGLLEFLTGSMFENYSQMTEEDVEKFTNLSGYKKKRFKINFKNCLKKECSLTYTIKYEVTDPDGKVTVAEIKRAAKIVQIDEIWKISDVTDEGSKSHFEGVDTITPDDFKKAFNTEASNIQLDESGKIQYDENGKAKLKN